MAMVLLAVSLGVTVFLLLGSRRLVHYQGAAK